MSKPETLKIDDVEYVRKDSIKNGVNFDGMPYMMVRTYSAGVFAGYLKSRNGKEVELLKARRIWKWAGAASLSQLAQSGTSNPGGCKFPEEVESVILTEAIELIPITDIAKKSLDSVEDWKC